MENYSLTIKSDEKKGVLDDITSIIVAHEVNISYTHLFIEKNNVGTIDLELEHVEDIDSLIADLESLKEVKSVEIHSSQSNIYGKRIIIVGGGAQVSQVALGAITEADRHNIRGEENIAEATDAVSRLPRAHVLVLAGSLMGGEISEAVKKIKKEKGVIVISLNMPGSVTEHADLIITDPVQAGVLAVMAIADTAVFDIKKLHGNIKY